MSVSDEWVRTTRSRLVWAGWATSVSGVIWLLVWVHFLASHGSSSFDQKRTPLGLDWHDTSRFLVIALALIMLALAIAPVGRGSGVDLARFVALGGWGAAAVGIIVALGVSKWGASGLSFTSNSARLGSLLIALGTLAGAVATIVFGRYVLREGLLPRGPAVPLAVGMLTAVPWLQATVWGFAFGLTWLAIGVLLLSRTRNSGANTS